MEIVFGIIVVALTVFSISYFYITVKSKERMALIQSGLDPESFKTSQKSTYHFLIIIGFLAIGISIGVAFGGIIEQFILHLKADEIAKIKINNPYYRARYEICYVFSTFLCGGISLILAFNYIKKIHAKNEENNI
jgi:hypothetical protein